MIHNRTVLAEWNLPNFKALNCSRISTSVTVFCVILRRTGNMLYCFQCIVAFFYSVLFRGRTLTAALLQEMNWTYNFEQAVV